MLTTDEQVREDLEKEREQLQAALARGLQHCQQTWGLTYSTLMDPGHIADVLATFVMDERKLRGRQ